MEHHRRASNYSQSSLEDDCFDNETLGEKGDPDTFERKIQEFIPIEEERYPPSDDDDPVFRDNQVVRPQMEEPARRMYVEPEVRIAIYNQPRNRNFTDTDTLEWISNNIPARECYKPVKTYRYLNTNVEVCHCYKKCTEHPNDDVGDNSNSSSLVWVKHKNTRTFQTNAFGVVHVHAVDNSFKGFVKYVRLDEEINMKLLQELLLDKWHLQKPDWILTVMGEVVETSHGQHQFWHQLKDTIIRLSSEKELWLLSEGIHYGLAKLVGKAAHHCVHNKKSRLTPIGVFGWGCLMDADQLIMNSREQNEMKELVVPTNQQGDYMSENISHSILVDNGTMHPQMCSSSYMTFTMDMITAISNHQQESTSIPSVILLYGGWSAVLDGLKRALALEIPVIVMKHSGGFADILATGFENCFSSPTYFGSNWSNSPVVDDILCEKLRKQIREIHDKDFEEGLYLIRQCLKKSHLFTICNLKIREDFFKVIIQALFKTKNNTELCRIFDQFFPQPVSAPEFLVTSHGIVNERTSQLANANKESLWVILMEAILMDKAEAVEFILNTGGIDLKAFFTNETIKHLYLRAMRDLPETLCEQFMNPEENMLTTVNEFVYSWIPNYCRHVNAKRRIPSNYDKFVKDMFIWAILSNKREIASVFWKKGKDLIATALVASSVLSGMANVENSINMKKNLQERADIFLHRAIGTLSECYNKDHDSTVGLMEHKWYNNQWDLDLVQVCLLEANCKITTVQAFHQFNKAQWRGRIFFRTGLFRIILTSLFFPLICCLTLREDEATIQNNPEEDHENQPENQPEKPEKPPSTCGCRKLCEFLSTPIVKFIHYMILYIAFLCLYGHNLLVVMKPEFAVIDIVLCVWVFSFLVEEIVQVIEAPGKADRRHSRFVHAIRNHLSSVWNVLDAVTLVLFIIGIIIRVIPDDNCYEVGRLFLSVDYLLFFWRMVHAFTAHKLMGPMLVMIWKMIIDLIPFLVLLFVSIMSFAITQEAILFPNSAWSVDFMYNLPRKAFWQMFGEFFLDDIEGTECSSNATLIENGTQRCPTTIGRYSVPIILSAYILLTNVLLLNIIIARFSFRFQTVQDKADEVWAWQSCYHTLDYINKPPVSPPLTLVWRFYCLVKNVFMRVCSCCCRNGQQEQNPREEMEGFLPNNPPPAEQGAIMLNDLPVNPPPAERGAVMPQNRPDNPPPAEPGAVMPQNLPVDPPVVELGAEMVGNGRVGEPIEAVFARQEGNPPIQPYSDGSDSDSDHWDQDEVDMDRNEITVEFSNLDDFEQCMGHVYLAGLSNTTTYNN